MALAFLGVVNNRLGHRYRSVAQLAAQDLENLKVLDTDNFSAISRLLRGGQGYYTASYSPQRPFGTEVEPRHFNIDLQKISFPDQSFDIVLTSDVMEHVRNVAAAHTEIFRILRPGGAYVFTVPFDERCERNVRLVDTSTDQDIFLCEPHIHGDPLGDDGGIVAYRIFGREIVSDLNALGFDVKIHRFEDEAAGVVGGAVFVATNTTLHEE